MHNVRFHSHSGGFRAMPLRRVWGDAVPAVFEGGRSGPEECRSGGLGEMPFRRRLRTSFSEDSTNYLKNTNSTNSSTLIWA